MYLVLLGPTSTLSRLQDKATPTDQNRQAEHEERVVSDCRRVEWRTTSSVCLANSISWLRLVIDQRMNAADQFHCRAWLYVPVVAAHMLLDAANLADIGSKYS
jgi:hypothetical protein